jgi:hypothetical protein
MSRDGELSWREGRGGGGRVDGWVGWTDFLGNRELVFKCIHFEIFLSPLLSISLPPPH